MSNNDIVRGSVLMYYMTHGGLNWIAGKAVELGEIIEDGIQPHMYFHCSIALSPTEKIEADGMSVAIRKIDFTEGFDVYTLPIHNDVIEGAISEVMTYKGEKYDWAEILDDAMRDLTGGVLHLPEEYVFTQEEHKKICSTLVAIYLSSLGVTVNRYAQPEDCYLAIEQYLKGHQQ